MTANLTRKKRGEKPAKPRDDFPLTPNGNGQWSKKVRRKVWYFGPWSDPDGALKRWQDQKDDLLAGRKPRTRNRDGLTVKQLCNTFLTAKETSVLSGQLSKRSWNDYKATSIRMREAFGASRLVDDLTPEDFEEYRAKLAKSVGTITLGNEIQRVRTILKYGFDADLIKVPVKVGPHFKRPEKKVRRRLRNARGPQLFTAAEIRSLLNAAGPQLRAMVLLGINTGMGNHDIATLPMDRLDLKAGWHTYGRIKTGVERRCPLWPETIKALRAVLKTRPEAKNDADKNLVFLTRCRERWVRLKEETCWIDSISLECGKLLRELGIKRPDINFYTLRRTFRTVADESGDQVATNYIMGHADADSDMAATYRQQIDDKRLRKVVNHVHRWLFPPKKAVKKTVKK